jgi:hypothetical protein
VKFAIIASARTGSSHLVDKLREHPEILCHGEVFHHNEVWVYRPKGKIGDDAHAELRELRRTDPEALMERVFAADYGRASVGFKIFAGQCDPVLDKLVNDRSVRKVVLYRRNVLANFASGLAAKDTGKWGTRKASGPEVDHRVQFRPAHFTRFHERYVGFYRRIIETLNANREVFLPLDYEDINNPYLFASLVNFIGGDPAQCGERLRKPLKKQGRTDILSRFSNPDVVRAFLEKNRLLHWMHESDPGVWALGSLAEPEPSAEPAIAGD